MSSIQLIVSYEDSAVSDFHPLTYLRPVGLLRAGIMPLFSRIRRVCGDIPVVLACRTEVGRLARTLYPELPVNPDFPGVTKVLFANSRLREFGDLLTRASNAAASTRFRGADGIAALLWVGQLPERWTDIHASVSAAAPGIREEKTTATMYHGLWEIVADIANELTADFGFLSPEFPRARSYNLHDGAYLLAPEKMYLSEGVEIMPGVVLDARPGPIVIGANTRLEPQTTIIGPCYIGPNSLVPFGRIADCSIGEVCRVGGEVEGSIFQSYTNKYHAGFIGHAYVGSWVNFGALTTNSDLKNNYSTVRVLRNGREIDTGEIKVGSFIGDHTKFGIGTLLTTGLTVGVGSNLFGGALFSEKEIGSFRWGSPNSLVPYDVTKAIETVRRTMGRRKVMLTSAEESMLIRLATREDDLQGTFDFS